MNATDKNIRELQNAAAKVVEQALADARRQDAEGFAGLMQAVKAGAMLSLKSTFAPAAGMASLIIELVEPGGTTHQLMACDLKRETTQ